MEGIVLLSPADLYRTVWADEFYAVHYLPGETSGRFPGRAADRVEGARRRCCRVGENVLGTIYGALTQTPTADQAGCVAAIWEWVRTYARRLVSRDSDSDIDPGIAQFARWVLGLGGERGEPDVPVAIWPAGYDWNLPFTVGGGIVWPSALTPTDPARIPQVARTFLHELVHVAQYRWMASRGAERAGWSVFGDWMQDRIIGAHGYVRLHSTRRICDWLTDYYQQNPTAAATAGAHPDWWRQAMQNPDQMGVWYGMVLDDGRLYLPWLVRVGGGMQTWMLPLEDRGGRKYITADRPVLSSDEVQRRMAARLRCGQYDHPHEIAAHRIVDELRTFS